MATGSVDGLVSGMSTSSVISGLMQVEAAPQNALKAKVVTQQKVVTAYQSINAKMKGLLTAAKTLTDPAAWKAGVATSSSDAATATTTATSSTQSGSLSFRVTHLAASHSVVFGAPQAAALTDDIMTGSSISLDVGGVTKPAIPITDKSLKGVVDAINKTADLGVRATAFQVSPGKYTMQLTSTTTGLASKFDFTGGTSPFDKLGAVAPVSEGADAELQVGDAATPLTVTSSTNTFKDLMSGLTVTAAKVQQPTDPPVTVTVASDTEGIAGKVQAMVDAANSALSEIAAQTKNKSGAVAGGPLAGNGIMSQVSSGVLGTVAGGTAANGSYKQVGIELTRDGQLTFDKAKFIAALNADPAKTQALFIDTAQTDVTLKTGLVDKLASVADTSTQTNTGTLSRLITSGNDEITDLNHRVGDWDVRLLARQATLQKQFGAMESALGKLKNQGNWLSGQLASLR